jgi:pimeloyl-ACP methyl ester carboxylesterase
METKKSIWGNLVDGFLGISQATVEGLTYVYQKGDEHKHYLLPALNGTIGDKLEAEKSKRAIQMSFRKDHSDVSIEDLSLEESLQKSQGELVVFVHGLMADEVLWKEPSRGKKGYGVLLQEEKNKTVLYVRYNSGCHISENGRSFSNLMEMLYKTYGTLISSTTIIAHSMGGLVTRSSCYYAGVQDQNWITKVKKIYLIGVPNDGAFLEKIGHLTTIILKKIWNFQTRMIANIADQRSNGIKDLRWGFMVDEDWQSAHSNDLLNVKRQNIPPLKGVQYFLLVGTLMEDENNVVSQYFGDGLVGKKSASGEIFSTTDAIHNEFLIYKVFSKIHHISLLTSSDVYDFLKETI